MIKMIADRAFTYAGRALESGEAFPCEERNVEGLIVIGYAHRARITSYQTRALQSSTQRTSKRTAA